MNLLFDSQSEFQLPFRIPDHLDSFSDHVVYLHARTMRRELETQNSSDFIGCAKDSIEIGFSVSGGKTVSDTRGDDGSAESARIGQLRFHLV